jgi:hypothetical protein
MKDVYVHLFEYYYWEVWCIAWVDNHHPRIIT